MHDPQQLASGHHAQGCLAYLMWDCAQSGRDQRQHSVVLQAVAAAVVLAGWEQAAVAALAAAVALGAAVAGQAMWGF